LRRGIPAPDGTFDVVYHSHLLEHFRREAGAALLRECFRVLRSRGIIRVAVPDLERIARTYLHALEEALRGETEWRQNYEWIMLELYDQTVRERSGGEMLAYMKRRPVPNQGFVVERFGSEARRTFQAIDASRGEPDPRSRKFYRIIWRRVRPIPGHVRRLVLRALLGSGGSRAFAIGQFRMSGEIHYWMYDRYSLGRALEQAGFSGPIVRSAHESLIPDWRRYCLDTEPDGSVYKPDSLYMEAVKP
jgi:SAM-dependent methyltransferase